jgi:hypothetical protein
MLEAHLGDGTCPMCLATVGVKVRPWSGDAQTLDLECPNCGPHLLGTDADTLLATRLHGVTGLMARVAHGVRRLPRSQRIDATLVRRLAEQTELPAPSERIDNLVLYLARAVEPGLPVPVVPADLRATVGTESTHGVHWALRQGETLGWIETRHEPGQQHAMLTVRGWQRHDELMRSGAGSRHAFMAMEFGDTQLDALYLEHLKPAVRATGFELRRNDEAHKTAGLIDNRMRVEIRTARFVLCDLTHGNRGAYWESGFAEGIGRPVVYVCRRDVFEHADPRVRPHFDIAHQAIVAWDPADPEAAMLELKAMIRATLPDEARLTD